MRNNVTRLTPDYVSSFVDSKILAGRIQAYWHNKGYTQVKVWVETELTNIEERKESYSIRSNIKFNCSTIERDLLYHGKA